MRVSYYRVSSPVSREWTRLREDRAGRLFLRLVCFLRGHVVNARYWLRPWDSWVPCERCHVAVPPLEKKRSRA